MKWVFPLTNGLTHLPWFPALQSAVTLMSRSSLWPQHAERLFVLDWHLSTVGKWWVQQSWAGFFTPGLLFSLHDVNRVCSVSQDYLTMKSLSFFSVEYFTGLFSHKCTLWDNQKFDLMFGDFIVCARSPEQKITCGFHGYEVSRMGKLIETKSRLVSAKGWGEDMGSEVWRLMGKRFLLRWWNVLKLDYGDDGIIL